MFLYLASVKNEWKKLIKKKKFIVFLIIEILICLGGVLTTFGVQKMSDNHIGANLFFANLPLSMMRFFIQVYIPLIVVMAISDLFASEIKDGTIRFPFMRPVSRLKTFLGKITSIFLMSVLYLFVIFTMTTAMKLITGAFSMASASVMYAFLAYFLNLIPLFILILFFVMIGQFTNSPSLSIIVSVILYMGLNLASLLIPQVSGLIFTDYILWHNIWLGISIPLLPLISKITLMVSYGIIFGSVGYYYFERREI